MLNKLIPAYHLYTSSPSSLHILTPPPSQSPLTHPHNLLHTLIISHSILYTPSQYPYTPSQSSPHSYNLPLHTFTISLYTPSQYPPTHAPNLPTHPHNHPHTSLSPSTHLHNLPLTPSQSCPHLHNLPHTLTIFSYTHHQSHAAMQHTSTFESSFNVRSVFWSGCSSRMENSLGAKMAGTRNLRNRKPVTAR